ncbi:MAG: lipoate--protein ligase family protein [Prevotella sp.]|nr:lipoate--protein ligase family protein [Prevotella sp.]
MKYVALPFTETRRLSFYLAMEEYVARHLDEPDCFFMWQVEPTVIFGRNQVVENEVNLDYCREHGIHVVRRKSGGGCVYADMDNVMLSFVTAEDNVGIAFNRFVNMVLLVFRKMGIEATGSSHNDIMIGDRKVCGTACYHVSGRSIVHSTLLYDTNMEHMLHAITPGPEKLEKKGIQSVRQRITFLKDYISLGLDEVKTLIRNTLCVDERMLTAEDVAGIEQLEQQYLREDFIKQLQ